MAQRAATTTSEEAAVPSVERTVTTATPLPVVWEYLSDFTHAAQWDPPTVSCELVSGTGEVGSTYRNVSGFLGSETEVTYEVTERVPQQRFQLRGDAGSSLDVLDTMTFVETTEGGTTVTYHADFDLHGAASLGEPLLPPALEALASRVASSLQRSLDGLPGGTGADASA